jgi:pantoate--beta-alanine ligase
MAADLHLPTEIVGAATVREPDGLAMSSRNQYLSAPERAAAPTLYTALRGAAERLEAGDTDYAGIETEGRQRLEAAGFRPDYFAVRTAELTLPTPAARELRVLAAGRLGRARLIDNLAVRVSR